MPCSKADSGSPGLGNWRTKLLPSGIGCLRQFDHAVGIAIVNRLPPASPERDQSLLHARPRHVPAYPLIPHLQPIRLLRDQDCRVRVPIGPVLIPAVPPERGDWAPFLHRGVSVAHALASPPMGRV